MNDSWLAVKSLGSSSSGVSAVMLIGMVAVATAWHWFGSLQGAYRFDLALTILLGEMNRAWSWTFLVLASLWAALFNADVRGSVLRCFRCANVLDVVMAGIGLFFYGYMFGLPERILDGVSMALIVLVSCLMMGGVGFLKAVSAGLVGYLLVGYAFTVIKGGVFFGRASWDTDLMMLDQWIFGQLPHRVVAGWAQLSTERLMLAEEVYLKLFAIMLMQLVVGALVGGRSFVERYGVALMTLYFVGAISYYALPAWGPFVADREIFSDAVWSRAVWEVASIQQLIFDNSLQVAAGNGAFAELHPYAFVAAMPSLHMAVPALAFWLWLPWKHLAVLAVLMCTLTAFSALATGMHYAVDLVAGILLAGASVVISNRVLRFSKGFGRGSGIGFPRME